MAVGGQIGDRAGIVRTADHASPLAGSVIDLYTQGVFLSGNEAAIARQRNLRRIVAACKVVEPGRGLSPMPVLERAGPLDRGAEAGG